MEPKSELTKVVVIRKLKTGPAQFRAEVERLKAAGKFPTLGRLLEVIGETRSEFRPRILAARAAARRKPVLNEHQETKKCL
jgi:hypothetical protein